MKYWHTMIDKTFKNKSDKVVIFQTPNALLALWLVAVIGKRVVKSAPWNSQLEVVATTTLLLWALLEVFRGVNYFRRILGLVVFAFVLMGLLMHNHM